MRRFSYILSFLTVALFILAVASTAKANGVDPKIIFQTANPCIDVCTNDIGGTFFSFTTPDGTSCTFTTPPGAANDCNVVNTGNATWTAITFDISPAAQSQAPSGFTCDGGPYFTNPCSIVADSDGDLTATFSGGTGVPVNNFPDLVISISGWDPGTVFEATISTPEPGSLALLLAGGGFFLAWKRRHSLSLA